MEAQQEWPAERSNLMARSDGVTTAETGPWTATIERVMARRGTVLLLGGPDTGKTTLARQLVNAAVEHGAGPVALVDADIGQGELGPPGTVGLATPRRVVESLSELRPERLAFVGATSPPGHLLPLVSGTHRLVDEARRRGAELILVDTSGLIRGTVARALKQAKVDLLRPDLVVAIQQESELEGILRLIETGSSAEVIRLLRPPEARQKPPTLRRAHRVARFYRWFAGARTFELSSTQVAISNGWLFSGQPLPAHRLRIASEALRTEVIYGEETEDGIRLLTRGHAGGSESVALKEEFGRQRVLASPAYVFQNLLVGLIEQDGNTADVGILQGVHFQRRVLTVLTPIVHVGAIRQVRLGRLRLRADGSEIGPIRPGDL